MKPREGFSTSSYHITSIETGRWRENTYLVYFRPTSLLFIIDPGADGAKIINLIEKQGVAPSFILLTHAHHDHVASVGPICQKYKIPFYLHPNDQRLLRQAPMYSISFGDGAIETPGTPTLFDALDGQRWTALTLEFEAGLIQALHTPGHTSGGVSYLMEGVIFTGDTLLHSQVGRTDLPGADKTLRASSVRSLFSLSTPETRLFPGHGEPWSVEEARRWWTRHAD